MTDVNGGGTNWRNGAAIAVIIAGTTQLGFTIWWAAHLDQTTLHIIQRANDLDAHVTRLDTVGGVKVHELSLRANIVDREAVLTNNKVDRLEDSMRQLLLLDERIKSIQIQTTTNAQRIEAVSRNMLNQQSQIRELELKKGK